MKQIIYYADNSSMGDTDSNDCNRFREWALQELKKEYPDYDVSVSSDQNINTVWTDDIENEYSITDFCGWLWDKCNIW